MTAVKYLIENEEYKSNININVKDIHDEYPLLTALYYEQNEILKYLVEHGGDYNVKNNYGVPLLVIAIQSKNDAIVEYLLRKPNININEKMTCGYSAFMTAVNINNSDMVELILDYADDNNIPVDINEKDASGNYPLTNAINRNNFDMVVSLMKYGIKNKIDMNLIDINGYSLLYLSYKQNYMKIFKYLSVYLDINQVDCTCQSIIFYAVNYNDIDTVEYLISHGADLNIRDRNNNSIIDYAIFNSNTKLLDILLRKDNILLNEYNSRGETPLISLIKNKKFSKGVKFNFILKFIKKGCDIEKVDKKYNLSPLIHAINNDALLLAKLLIFLGVNINHKNKDGYSPLRYSHIYTKGKYKFRYLDKIMNYLFNSIRYNIIDDKNDDVKNFSRLLPTILDVNITNKDGNSLLHEAVLNKQLEITKLLIQKGINKQMKNNNREDANDLNEKNNKDTNVSNDEVNEKNKIENNEGINIYNEIHNLLS